MRNDTFRDTADILARRRKRRAWQKLAGALSCVVVFCITYALILPALSLEKTQNCEKQEHAHTESCYTQITTVSQKKLVCTAEQAEHVHTEECYQTVEEPVDTQALTCRLEASESHQHGPLCYGTWVLNCGLEAHTHSTECFDALQNPSPSEASAASTTPLQLNGYVDDAVLFYRTSADADWKKVDASTTLPGNAELKLEISYKDVHVDALRRAGLQITYTLPQILRTPTGSGQINDTGNQKMGTMTVANSLVTLTFDETWLDNHHSATGNDVISGKFHVQSQIDLTMAGGQPSTQITVGNVTITLNFEPDIIAKHADVTIRKNDPVAIHEAGADYLEYTLTVKAKEDGAPNVVVKDDFTDKSQIRGYVGISKATPAVSGVAGPVETGAPEGQAVQCSMDDNTGTMVWTIGIMAPNETRTLTYRVKLKEGYLGGKAPTNPAVNTAELFCGTYWRGKDTATFTPKAEATMSKAAGDFIPDPDGSGGGTITYTIWIQAKETNTYTLTNVKIWDALDGSIAGGGDTKTHSDYLKYLSYVIDSFRLYDGGVKDQNGDSGLKPEGGNQVTPVFQKKADGTTDNTYFLSCDAGTLAPGQSKTLIYKVHVGPGVFPAAGNEAPRIKNRAQIHAGDPNLGNEAALNSFTEHVDVTKKEWSTKHSGVEQATDTTVTVTGKVYKADGSLAEDPLTEFTAPAGSYQYTVTVNEKGDWDVSNASLKDQLQGNYSTYIGYVRVDAYNVDASDNRTLQKTLWLAVDGLREFTFTPSKIGLTGVQSYDLTYFTSVTIPGGVPVVNVENKVTMTGSVGIGNVIYNLTGAYVTASNTVVGSNSFSVSKYSWYYEPSKVPEVDPDTNERTPYANGAIYWYIQVDGSVLPAGTYLQDRTFYVPEFIYADSLVGIYTGNMGERSISSYDDLEDLLASDKLTRLDESSYDTPVISSYKENGKTFPTMTVRLKNRIQLNAGESLFLIIKMEPSSDPADLTGTGFNTYQNKVQSSWNGTNWVEWDSLPTMVLYGSNGINKTLEKVSTWNGTQETVVSPADGTAAPEALTGLENGTYVFWNVQLNYTGRLHGNYYVEELIPDGLELAYVECTGVGKGYTDATMPSCAPKSPGDGWTPHQRAGDLTTNYYTKGQTARWYVEGLKTDANPTKPTHTIGFRVVCRVTDKDALLGGMEKTFQNQVKLCREGGKEIDSSSSAVIWQSHTLSKEELYAPETDSTRIPFVITLNPLGEDLVPGAETLSLLDTLSDTLKLDISSIRVTETGTNTLVTDWESSVNGQTLTLTLPDQKALTVSYSTWIIAKPGDRISISNDAHWEGYSSHPSGAVAPDAFEFNVSASAGTFEKPSIIITKLDENHLTKVLKGAEFTLTQAVEQANGEITETTGINWTGTTDANGQLTFGVASDQTMEYNTIYCLRETQAPAGYVLDSTPHYFVIAKKVTAADKTEAYPEFPANVYVHYLGSEYSYQALNHKGRITIHKTFTDPGGNDCAPVVGTYTFGLYKTADGSGIPDGTVTISYSDTDTAADKKAVFQDLPFDQSYYVFELDAEGKPILDGGILSNRFKVTYRYPEGADCAALTAQNGDQTVTVTNMVRTPELPETGGAGTTIFYVAGWILFAGAAVLLFKRKRVNAEA